MSVRLIPPLFMLDWRRPRLFLRRRGVKVVVLTPLALYVPIPLGVGAGGALVGSPWPRCESWDDVAV